MEVIFCASGNRRYAEIAIAAGMKYGARMPDTVYFPPYFVDQDWRKPDRQKYMAALEKHKPAIATVLDLEREEQLPEVLNWAEEAAQHTTTVVIIPKVGIIDRLPHRIGDADVRLGYSVPTRYGASPLPPWAYEGWSVHLLGGSPRKQLTLRHYMNVESADGNVAQLAAQKGTAFNGKVWKRYYHDTDKDFPYRLFAESCQNIMKAWNL